tara:strand:+ start:153 stop:662 length:510 start_codon:yes stop_codon:yes gene_type:complete
MPNDPGDIESITLAVLLEQEVQARSYGSGIQATALLGEWSPQRLWGKGEQQENQGQTKLLQWLNARLSISAAQEGRPGDLNLCNSVSLGPLKLRFNGQGWLQGKRPLLCFRFEKLSLELGGSILFQRPLPEPKPKRAPFFALITVQQGQWLVARGRGGGLALWSAIKSP